MSERGIFGGLIDMMDFECLDDKEDLDFWVQVKQKCFFLFYLQWEFLVKLNDNCLIWQQYWLMYYVWIWNVLNLYVGLGFFYLCVFCM